MPVVLTAMGVPGQDSYHTTAGAAVNATIRRNLLGSKLVVTAEQTSGPIGRGGAGTISLYINGTPGEQFELDMCFEPAFINGQLDEATSKWALLSTLTYTLDGAGHARQSFEDAGFAFRVRKVGLAGTFDVHIWTLN